jgi:hypothetical protein
MFAETEVIFDMTILSISNLLDSTKIFTGKECIQGVYKRKPPGFLKDLTILNKRGSGWRLGQY